MHKQHPQTAYRKYAVSIGTIFENCDKTAWIHGMPFKGLGVPNKHFAAQMVFV